MSCDRVHDFSSQPDCTVHDVRLARAPSYPFARLSPIFSMEESSVPADVSISHDTGLGYNLHCAIRNRHCEALYHTEA